MSLNANGRLPVEILARAKYCHHERANSDHEVCQQGWYKKQEEPEDNIFYSCKHQLDASTEGAKQMFKTQGINRYNLSTGVLGVYTGMG